MTNKLPVVGQRYRELHNFNEWECSDLIIENEQSETGFAIMTALHNKTKRKVFNLNNYFFRFFEELPEDEAETKPETQSYDSESIKKDQMDKAMQSINDLRVYREGYNKGWNECLEEVKKQMPNHISELSPEVKEAMEELKKADNWFRNNASITLPEHCFKLSNTAFCLLNALDKQFSLNGYFEGLPPSREAIERSKAQPDENGSFKDIDGAEELSQELMKENIEPNKETLKSFSDYRKGVGLTKYDSVEELFDDLEGKNS